MNRRIASKRIVIGADDAGIELKRTIVEYLRDSGYPVDDIGVASPEEAAAADLDYPDIAERLARGIAAGRWDRGILICGTGIEIGRAHV